MEVESSVKPTGKEIRQVLGLMSGFETEPADLQTETVWGEVCASGGAGNWDQWRRS